MDSFSAHNRVLKGLPRPLLLFVLVLAAFAFLSGLDGLLGYWRVGRPALVYLWVPHPGFDFFDYTPRFPYLHTPQFFTVPAYFPWVYPAPGIFFLYPFYLLTTSTHWVVGFLVFCSVGVAADLCLALRFRTALTRRGLAPAVSVLLIGTLILLGWPLYFAFQRGNIESLLWVGIAAGVFCFAHRRYAAAALLIGVFGSAKVYPLLFLALMLNRKQSRYLVLGVFAAAATTLAGLRFLEPDALDAWRQISTGVGRWTEITTRTYGPEGVGAGHSLLGLLRVVTDGAVLRSPHALGVYLAVVGTLASAGFLVRVRRLPALNQALFIACAAILLPPTSYDYTLVFLLIPWAWLVLVCVEQARAGHDANGLVLPMMLFGTALAPLTFLHTYGSPELSFEGPVRSLVLLVLLVYAAWRPVDGIAAAPDGPAAMPAR